MRLRKNANEPNAAWALALVLGVIVVWASSGVLIYYFVGADRGIFGDMFGAVNALFAGLAFVGFLYTILLQRADLKLQRHEHDLARAEMVAQREQLVLQNATLRLQSFENTFFQLLRLQNDIVNAIDLTRADTGEVTVKGRDCFRVFFASFCARWSEALPQDAGPTTLDRIRRTYLNFSAEIEAEAGHYFMTLYNILKYVDSSDVEHKKRYTNLVRAQLSSYEVALLFYTCLSERGAAKFKPLIERYAMLKMLPRNELLEPAHIELYDAGAFGSGRAPASY
jgi:hypothetical protein